MGTNWIYNVKMQWEILYQSSKPKEWKEVWSLRSRPQVYKNKETFTKVVKNNARISRTTLCAYVGIYLCKVLPIP